MAEIEERTGSQVVNYYTDYIKRYHIEPSVKALNRYIEECGGDKDDKASRLSIDAIRRSAFEQSPELLSMVYNEADFTENYFERLEEALKTHKKFIVATAVDCKAAKVDFYNSLLTWANQNDGLILLLPSFDRVNTDAAYKLNFDPLFKNDRTWVLVNKPREKDVMIKQDESLDGVYLNKHLWLNCTKLQSKSVNPINTYKKIVTSKDASIIIGHPKQLRDNIGALKNKTPKMIWSTGAVTVNNYKMDMGMIASSAVVAKEAHQYGAVIVEIRDEETAYCRNIQSIDGKSFTDLHIKYNPDGTVEKANDTVLVLGDSHAAKTDMKLLKYTLQSLCLFGSIGEVVLHDLCDARAVSPHDKGKLLTLEEKMQMGRHLLKDEFNNIAQYLNDIMKFVPAVTVVSSNHDEHLKKALEDLKYYLERIDENTEMLIHMTAYAIRNFKACLLKHCVETYSETPLDRPDNIKWLLTDESYVRYNTELGQHGHLGLNGSRGNARQFELAVGNAVIGHSHSARVTGRTFQVGTMSELDQGYNRGLSSWSRTCCLVHADGSKQMLDFMRDENGEYSFKID